MPKNPTFLKSSFSDLIAVLEPYCSPAQVLSSPEFFYCSFSSRAAHFTVAAQAFSPGPPDSPLMSSPLMVVAA
jgi:hypothetical protein